MIIRLGHYNGDVDIESRELEEKPKAVEKIRESFQEGKVIRFENGKMIDLSKFFSLEVIES